MGNLGALAPALITGAIELAERFFPKRFATDKRGPEKRTFILEIVGKLYDELQDKGRMPRFLSRDLVVALVGILIDESVSAMKDAVKLSQDSHGDTSAVETVLAHR